MQAIVRREYGPPEVLRLEEVDRPIPGDGEVLVRVLAAGVNPGDWDILRGTPFVIRLATGLRRPRNGILGLAIAGTVEAIGRGVSGFRPGDDVYAEIGSGGFAEFAAVPARSLAPKPGGLTFEQASAVPVSGTTALQALRDIGRVQPGTKVLVNGASGGVGTFAVQIAKVLGTEVTGVCGPANVELVESLGADHVIDYTLEDFTRNGRQYDLILDNVGNRTLSEFRRALAPRGMLIPNSNKGAGRWLGGYLRRAIQAAVVSPFVSHRLRPFAATGRAEDLRDLTDLIESGRVRPVIDRSYPLREVPQALAHYGAGHARGKVVVTMEPDAARNAAPEGGR